MTNTVAKRAILHRMVMPEHTCFDRAEHAAHFTFATVMRQRDGGG